MDKKQDPIGRVWFGRRRGRKNDVSNICRGNMRLSQFISSEKL
jgi:hypothetical protein